MKKSDNALKIRAAAAKGVDPNWKHHFGPVKWKEAARTDGQIPAQRGDSVGKAGVMVFWVAKHDFLKDWKTPDLIDENA